jgi:hypothetical protein
MQLLRITVAITVAGTAPTRYRRYGKKLAQWCVRLVVIAGKPLDQLCSQSHFRALPDLRALPGEIH